MKTIKKAYIPLLLLLVVLFSGAMFSVASAQETNTVSVHGDANIGLENQAVGNHDNGADATVTANEDNQATTSTEGNDNGELTAEQHRSTVASFVQSLRTVADHEGIIGTQVRVIAEAQDNEASTSAEAITRVANKGKFSTFLFGSDYASLGQLRSEMVTTQNNIDQLKTLLTQATTATDKAELAAQIKVLEDSQVKLDAFVTAHENTFSLFGWFTRWFAK